MFKNKFEKVYVVCPAAKKTGGLELLHQLVFTLNAIGVNSTIAYTTIKKNEEPTNEAYKKYVTEYIPFEKIEDNEKYLVIISEHQIELMNGFKKAEVAIWWLSVDNYQKVYEPFKAYKLLGLKGIAWYVKHCRWQYRVSKIKKEIKYNLAQSFYAIDYLKNNGFSNIVYLSDYINTDYLNVKINKNKVREDIVLYNPKKGKKFSDYLISLDSSIKWIPLIDLNNEQVKELLLSSKVYVDFGNHPGKDRFPREAAMCGCCVITDKKGSAKFYEDVSISNKYKFEDKKKYGEAILNCIRYCFDNYEICFEDFNDYRNIILCEKEKFVKDVKEIFLN